MSLKFKGIILFAAICLSLLGQVSAAIGGYGTEDCCCLSMQLPHGKAGTTALRAPCVCAGMVDDPCNLSSDTRQVQLVFTISSPAHPDRITESSLAITASNPILTTGRDNNQNVLEGSGSYLPPPKFIEHQRFIC